MTASVISAPVPASPVGELVVGVWTGRRATQLRVALRLTQQGFADLLGVAVRTVAKWAANPGLVPTPLVQSMLDTVLDRAGDPARTRFALLGGAA